MPVNMYNAEEVIREEPELRIDKTDGNAYNLASFIAEYGGSQEVPPSAWLSAEKPIDAAAPSSKSRRSSVKNSKKKNEVVGTTAPAWNMPAAPPASALATPESPMYGSVEQFATSKTSASAAKPNTRRLSVEHARVDDDLYGS